MLNISLDEFNWDLMIKSYFYTSINTHKLFIERGRVYWICIKIFKKRDFDEITYFLTKAKTRIKKHKTHLKWKLSDFFINQYLKFKFDIVLVLRRKIDDSRNISLNYSWIIIKIITLVSKNIKPTGCKPVSVLVHK